LSSCWTGLVGSFSSFAFIAIVAVFETFLTLQVRAVKWRKDERCTLTEEGVRDFVPTPREKALRFWLNMSTLMSWLEESGEIVEIECTPMTKLYFR